MSQLPLDDPDRHPLARALDRVRVTELVRREPAPNTSRERVPAQLSACGGRRPRPPASRSVDHTEQRAAGQLDATGEPRGEMIAPRPGVHPDLPELVALPSAHENRPPPRVEIRLDQ